MWECRRLVRMIYDVLCIIASEPVCCMLRQVSVKKHGVCVGTGVQRSRCVCVCKNKCV
jgi:hypothetical protein